MRKIIIKNNVQPIVLGFSLLKMKQNKKKRFKNTFDETI